MAKWYEYLFPIVGTALKNAINMSKARKSGDYSQFGTDTPDPNDPSTYNSPMRIIGDQLSLGADKVNSAISDVWDDLTGKSSILLQNQLNRELAEEEYQRNLQAIGDTAAAYDAAGFNKNLLYSGASPASYSAPQLQAYSGSAKLDTILNRSAKVLGMIPALYQATASLEGIDQARERTKQSEIKTMAMGMDLINKGYNLGDKYFSKPYAFDLSNFYIPGRHFDSNKYGFDFVPESKHFTWHDTDGKAYEMFGKDVYKKYMDASLRNQFDLLESIGLGNSLRRTRNAYMGYQYDLDRRYGAAGRIVGMASQSLGAAAKLMPGMKYFFK